MSLFNAFIRRLSAPVAPAAASQGPVPLSSSLLKAVSGGVGPSTDLPRSGY